MNQKVLNFKMNLIKKLKCNLSSISWNRIHTVASFLERTLTLFVFYHQFRKFSNKAVVLVVGVAVLFH